MTIRLRSRTRGRGRSTPTRVHLLVVRLIIKLLSLHIQPPLPSARIACLLPLADFLFFGKHAPQPADKPLATGHEVVLGPCGLVALRGRGAQHARVAAEAFPEERPAQPTLLGSKRRRAR
jgi:hypothetical protein